MTMGPNIFGWQVALLPENVDTEAESCEAQFVVMRNAKQKQHGSI